MKRTLNLPLDEKEVRSLHTGDNILLSGIIYTGRDAAHKFFTENPEQVPVSLNGAAIYHCGPITVKKESKWIVTAAGPTTSSRLESYTPEIIEKFGVRAIIGKGGLGYGTLNACKQFGCVYLSAVGGCAQVLAESIKCVRNVYFYEEFGSPEAVWELEVENFPAIVTMDSYGNSLYE